MTVKRSKSLTPGVPDKPALTITDPYRVIRDFFSAAPLKHYRKFISQMLNVAYSEDYWKESDPGSLLRFEQQMLELITACHGLVKSGKNGTGRKKKAVVNLSVFTNGIKPSSYFGWQSDSAIWEFFPRNLTKREFLNPYKVYTGFFRHKDILTWLTEFKELISFALEPFGNETGIDYDYLGIFIQLQKLVEASHLIHVRVNRLT